MNSLIDDDDDDDDDVLEVEPWVMAKISGMAYIA
jgi:hypothetical protein